MLPNKIINFQFEKIDKLFFNTDLNNQFSLLISIAIQKFTFPCDVKNYQIFIKHERQRKLFTYFI